MENAVMLNFTPTQLLISLGLYVWLVIIFPIIVIRKLNYIVALLQHQQASQQQASDQEASS